ncbi:MAG: MBOAT family protein [Muribaculaceae bacterium]|nr:MBOAT family protein [Muribaculaceae bacterium]
MLFNSFQFLVFLPIVFALYWFVFKNRRWQNLLVVVVSYVFYGWWDWRFLGLIALTSLCSYASGILIERFDGRRRQQRLVSAANIILNLGILCYFKYANFFVENLDLLLQSLFGYRLDWVASEIILPVGISFYTFQALSYTIDVYRGNIRATHDIVEFLAFISFFPQLVAGPIERATHLLPQFQRDRRFDYTQAVDGLRQMLWGFVKKIVVADRCASDVNALWGHYEEMSGLSLLLVGVLFAFQIYCDFSGYSDIAIGCARLFGINLMRNFNYPYFARNIREFWQRWHISLTTWFRDYIYIPLGGNRCKWPRVALNVLVVWAISGLWHGAKWTFVCWGLFHAVLLISYRLLSKRDKTPREHSRPVATVIAIAQTLFTFLLVVVGWIFFRAESMPQACDFLSHIATNFFSYTPMDFGKYNLTLCCMVMLFEWLQRDKQHALQLDGVALFRHSYMRYAVYLALLALIFFGAGRVQTFIYFQF